MNLCINCTHSDYDSRGHTPGDRSHLCTRNERFIPTMMTPVDGSQDRTGATLCIDERRSFVDITNPCGPDAQYFVKRPVLR
jgi:hypothetical protein